MMFNGMLIGELEKTTTRLWQGEEIDIDQISKDINDGVEQIIEFIPSLQECGVDFPMEYVTNAMRGFVDATNKMDDYLLADNLWYEWREIFEVFKEVVNEVSEK